MEWLASQRHECFSHCFILGWVSVHQWGNILGGAFPVVYQLRFTNKFADSSTDHVYADHNAVALFAN
jgi:hypothetical protein